MEEDRDAVECQSVVGGYSGGGGIVVVDREWDVIMTALVGMELAVN